MLEPAIIAGSLRLPRLTPGLPSVRRELTVKVWEPGEQVPLTLKSYRQNRNWIYLPRDYGIKLCERWGIAVEDRTCRGGELRDLPPIKLWHEQVKPVAEMVLASKYDFDVQMQSKAATGKTVMALEVARQLGRTTLIVVDTNFLRDQWAERIEQHFGISSDEVGIIQGTKTDISDDFFTVAMLQTLYNRKLPMSVRRAFGTVVFDECHGTGAPQFNQVLYKFPAQARFGVTATPRNGALGKIIKWHIGSVKVKTKTKHRPSKVYYLESDTVYSWYANISPKTGRFINEIAGDGVRNLLLAKVIRYLYDYERDSLIISDRIEQLEALMALCLYSGIPQEAMGLCTAHRHIYKYAKDLKPIRKPDFLEKGCEYTPVMMQMVKKRASKAKLDEAKGRQIIFATYAIFHKGVDVPRLSAGLDCTPRSGFEQTHGRILRLGKGKKVPIWITMRDISSYRAEYQFANRIAELVKSNVEVFRWHPDKGVQRRDAGELKREASDNSKRLKLLRIGTTNDGSFTIQT